MLILGAVVLALCGAWPAAFFCLILSMALAD
jgi:hypothetical protein